MGLGNHKGLGPDDPGIIATQSTHKQLASFSQASQIHVKDTHIKGQQRRVEHRRLNESVLVHASTSPFYPLFASLDVGAHMMKGRSGEVLWDDTIRLGIELRKKLRMVAPRVRRGPRPGAPLVLRPLRAAPGGLAPARRDRGASRRRGRTCRPTTWPATRAFWAMSGSDDWHGFHDVPPGFAMTDPNKLTLLMPGFDRSTGDYLPHGVPAPVLAEYLRENRIVPEKNDLHSILFLLTPGVESSKAGTLLSWLVTFKRLHDENARLQDVVPGFVKRRTARYHGMGVRDLCGQMQAFYRDARISTLQRQQFQADHLPDLAMAPHEAGRMLVRNRVDYLPISQVAGRIAATLMLVYPPGIATIVPGERLGGRAHPHDRLPAGLRAPPRTLFPGLEHRDPGRLPPRPVPRRKGPLPHLRRPGVTALLPF